MEALLQLCADVLSPPRVMERFWRDRPKTATGQNRYTMRRRKARAADISPTPTPA